MSQNPPTTDRARRQRGVETGAESDAVDRVPDPPDPRGRGPQTTARSRQTTTARDVAGELGIDRSGVGTVDRIEGMDVFLRSGGADEFAEIVQTDFASDADFVAPDDRRKMSVSPPIRSVVPMPERSIPSSLARSLALAFCRLREGVCRPRPPGSGGSGTRSTASVLAPVSTSRWRRARSVVGGFWLI